MFPLKRRIERPRYYLMGYVLNNEGTLRIRAALSGTNIIPCFSTRSVNKASMLCYHHVGM